MMSGSFLFSLRLFEAAPSDEDLKPSLPSVVGHNSAKWVFVVRPCFVSNVDYDTLFVTFDQFFPSVD